MYSLQRHCKFPPPQIYNLPGSFPCILPLSRHTMLKCFASGGDTTPTNGNLRLLLCQTARLQLHHQAFSHVKSFQTWAARLLDEGLRYTDRGPRRQHSIPCILSAEALWAQCPICEAGQRGHLPCRAVSGSHQTALGSELLRAQILDTHGSDQCYHLSALIITHSPASTFRCAPTSWLQESNPSQKQTPRAQTPGPLTDPRLG